MLLLQTLLAFFCALVAAAPVAPSKGGPAAASAPNSYHPDLIKYLPKTMSEKTQHLLDRLVILSEEAHDAKEAFEKALATERAAETAETIAMLDGAQAATEDLAKGGNAPKKDKLHQKTDVPASALQRRDTSTPPPDPRTLYRSISDADMDMVDKLIGEGHDAEGLTLYRMLTQPLNAVTAAKTAVVVAKVREAEQKIAKIIDAPQKDKLWEKPIPSHPNKETKVDVTTIKHPYGKPGNETNVHFEESKETNKFGGKPHTEDHLDVDTDDHLAKLG